MVRRTQSRGLDGSRVYNGAIRGRQNGNPGSSVSMSETVYASIRVSARHHRTAKEQCFWAASLRHAERCLEILPPARLSFRPRKLISLFSMEIISPLYFRPLVRTSSKFGRRAHENSEDNSHRPIGCGHFLRRPGRRPDLGVPPSAGGGGLGDPPSQDQHGQSRHCRATAAS